MPAQNDQRKDTPENHCNDVGEATFASRYANDLLRLRKTQLLYHINERAKHYSSLKTREGKAVARALSVLFREIRNCDHIANINPLSDGKLSTE